MDLIDVGIIDLATITRNALDNAASAAGITLTTETMVTHYPEKTPATPAATTPADMYG